MIIHCIGKYELNKTYAENLLPQDQKIERSVYSLALFVSYQQRQGQIED